MVGEVIAYFITNAKKKVIRCHSRLFPFSSTISLNEKLNSEDLGVWIPFPLLPRRNPTKLIIEQSYVFQRPRFTGEPEIRTFTQEIDIKKLTARQYKQSIIKDCFQSDFELFFTFILLSWPQANIDRNCQNVAALQIELEGSQYYLKFHFEGWNMYYINSIDLKSFIYYPNLESNYWTIYQGKYQMPKRIYFFANTRANLEILLKRIKWFQGRKVQIQTVSKAIAIIDDLLEQAEATTLLHLDKKQYDLCFLNGFPNNAMFCDKKNECQSSESKTLISFGATSPPLSKKSLSSLSNNSTTTLGQSLKMDPSVLRLYPEGSYETLAQSSLSSSVKKK
uniref:Uncharacterized protein n=1 Tax=Panagrolaimus davidi TaxID=227884 RepID=A0A914PP18_9BILA